MEINNKFVENVWIGMCIVKYFMFALLIALMCSCSSTPKSVVIYDIKPHLVFNREIMKGDTLISIQRWSSVNRGIEQDSIINETTIGALVLFHNMRIEHAN